MNFDINGINRMFRSKCRLYVAKGVWEERYALSGTGSVFTGSGESSDRLVLGNGTKFLTEIFPGDKITIGGQTRLVESVEDDYELYVDDDWIESISDGELIKTVGSKESFYLLISNYFIPLGALNEEMGTISWEQEPIAIDFGTIPGPTKVTAEFNSIMVNPEMVNWLNSSEDAKGSLTVVVVPDGETVVKVGSDITFRGDLSTILALSGVKVTNKGNISLKGDLSVISVNVEEVVNRLEDKLIFKVI